MDVLAEHVVENKDYLLVRTVSYVLICLYKLGYTPSTGDSFFTACINILRLVIHMFITVVNYCTCYKTDKKLYKTFGVDT